MLEGKAEAKLKRFVAHYLADPERNGTKAAISAGYAPKSAHVTASRLLKNAKVQQLLQAETAKVMDKLGISKERVIEGLGKLAFFDVRKFWNEDGSLKKVTELDEETAFALQGYDVEKLYEHFGSGKAAEKGTVTKMKMADRGLNLERLGRYFKLFTDKVEHAGLEAFAEELQKARLRARS